MRTTAILAVVLLVGMGAMANMVITASEPYPDPGTMVAFQLEGAPEGATFRWTLGEHGTSERSERWLRWVVPEGYHVVEVEALRDGSVLARARYGLLVDWQLGATRTVTQERNHLEVRITVRVKKTVTGGLSLIERTPEGWAAGTPVTDGDLSTRGEDGRLYTSWWSRLEEGTQTYCSYALYPDASGRRAELSGEVVAYINGERVERPVGGELTSQ